VEPRISFVTLGVADLDRATAFYRDVLRLPCQDTTPGVRFFAMGPLTLALHPRPRLAADAGIDPAGTGFAGVTLSHNVRTRPEVDRLLAEAAGGGGALIRPGRETDWGGYAGYFADPDGFVWEVAWNERFPFA
jgi:uncharacterized protein